MATIEQINPLQIKASTAGKGGKFKGVSSGLDYNSYIDAASAMGSTATTAANVYGNSNAATVLGAAFSGISQASASFGSGSGGVPSYATGFKSDATSIGAGGVADASTSVIPGADGMSQMDLINTMNQNNLSLLELQAVMQNNMQSWNTKSNILSADHRARMAMIEKFTARG